MDFSHLNPIPEWKYHLKELPEGEAWKFRESLQAAEALYRQWREVFGLVSAFAENLREDKDENNFTKQLIYENAHSIAPKIISAAGDALYQIKMENAALIRFNCRQMMEQIDFATLTGAAEEPYRAVIEAALNAFKALFSQWVATFAADNCPDEWGLFGERTA